MNRDNGSPAILAFVHIEKSAGTTFIHILRRNYFLRYLDCRPLKETSRGVFTAADLRIVRKVNPFLSCIGGHSVAAYSDLAAQSQVRFVTLIRDPIKRYLSQFNYRRGALSRTDSFEQYLNMQRFNNFQTKKIAGEEDLERAKEILNERFMLVGSVEKFDEFLILLAQRSGIKAFDPFYSKKNVAANAELSQAGVSDFAERILANNSLDLALYEYWADTLWPRYVASYVGDFEADVRALRDRNRADRRFDVRPYADYMVRKLYLDPITGFIRVRHGLPRHGSY